MWVLSHFDVTIGLVPTWSYIGAECHSWNGGTYSVTRNTQSGTEGHSDMNEGCSLTWPDKSAGPFWCDWGMCSHLIRYKGCCHSLGNGGTWSVTRNPQSGTEIPFDAVLSSMVRCKCRDLSMRCFQAWSIVSAEPFRCGAFEHGRL